LIKPTCVAGCRRIAGVTLIELVVVMAIAAILAALALPCLRPRDDSRRLAAATDRLVAEIDHARLSAMADGQTWRLVFDPPRCSIGPVGSVTRRLEFEDVSYGSIVARDHNGSSIPADGVRFDDNRLSFSAMGSCNAGTIFLTCGKLASSIAVQPASGLAVVRLYDGSWHAR